MTHTPNEGPSSNEVSTSEILAAAQARKKELFTWVKGFPARPKEMRDFEAELRWDRATEEMIAALPAGFRRTLVQFLLPNRKEEKVVEPVRDATSSEYVLQQVRAAREEKLKVIQTAAVVSGNRTTKELQPVAETFLAEIEQFISLYDGRTLPDDEYERGQQFVDRAPKVIADLLGRKKQTLVPLATRIEEAARVVEAMLKEQA